MSWPAVIFLSVKIDLYSLKMFLITSSPKGNDAHLRAIMQSEKKWKHQFFRRLRAANSVVRGRTWHNFKLTKLFCMSSLPVSMKKIPSRTTEKKWQHRFSNYNTINVAMETSGWIWPNVELIQALMYVIFT